MTEHPHSADKVASDRVAAAKMAVARVAVTLPIKETFLYTIPDGLAPRAGVGCRVLVPFRSRKVAGYIVGKNPAAEERKLKEIAEVLDTQPLFQESLVPFLEWMADYYLHPLGRLIESALPAGLKVRSFRTAKLTERGNDILQFLPAHSDEKKLLSWIRDHPGKRLACAPQMFDAFQKRGWVSVENERRRGEMGPLERISVKPREGVTLEFLMQGGAGGLGAKNEPAFLRRVFEEQETLLKDLSSEFSNGPYLLKKWIKRGALETQRTKVFRDPAGNIVFPSPPPITLYEQQQRVLDAVKGQLDRGLFAAFLLHGVTGSGKTEVYWRAIEHVRRLGRRAILMLPEIALSVYMEGLFRSRLGRRVAVYHSGLSGGERYDQWMSMVKGEVDLVIGARSALFSPLDNLGLIIVDEEHDLSYKQEESPRYQARDAALVRGRMENALVILGSGTPSVQSYHNAQAGKHALLSMPERVEKRPLPEVTIVDMKGVEGDSKKSEIISPVLKEALNVTLAEGNQTIFFLNRRGFNRVYLCKACGEPVHCPNCDVGLIYHLKENQLACHYCGFRKEPQAVCGHCGFKGMRAYGFGTERLEKELKELHPGKRIARMDRDVLRRKGQTFQLINQFSHREIDILVGTQMITKGYDFPNVTLVGIIDADFSLAFPDFRAAERTFQLLSQVAGRAGRGDRKGRVIIQTFNPDHYAITDARNHDYRAFYEKEKELRKQLAYPPFSHLACLRLQGNTEVSAEKMTRRFAEEMGRMKERWPKQGKDILILGPVEAPFKKLKGKYRWQILVKSKRRELLHVFLERVNSASEAFFHGTGVKLMIDVDPYQMM